MTGVEKRVISPSSHATVKEVIQPNPGAGHQSRHIPVIGAGALQLRLDLRDPELELVDQLDARVDMARHGCGIPTSRNIRRPP